MLQLRWRGGALCQLQPDTFGSALEHGRSEQVCLRAVQASSRLMLPVGLAGC